jgi:hypothetical protein
MQTAWRPDLSGTSQKKIMAIGASFITMASRSANSRFSAPT